MIKFKLFILKIIYKILYNIFMYIGTLHNNILHNVAVERSNWILDNSLDDENELDKILKKCKQI